ncbi:RHS repeat-associated core domain-containing protein, partial [Pseudomonas sp. YuFO8]|uniref:RHS repeat-associated core domain-containing protein n=1 Tax=Pseudomonas sp. YuFO8 TaxID=3095361 RepID=UPI002B2519AA
AYDKGGYNFLGNGSGQTFRDDGLDNLYNAPLNYEYTTRETIWDSTIAKAVNETERVFNCFHLLIREATTQYSTDPTKDHTLLVTENQYHLVPGLEFKDQPPYCQLPKTVTRTWRELNTTNPRHEEIVTTTYDDFGNLLTQVNADGVTETYEWYQAQGEVGCPPDPQGFVRNLKSKTVTPAPSRHGKAPELITHYRYSEQPGLTGHGPWLALRDETLSQLVGGRVQTQLRCIAHEYINDPSNPQQHGLMNKTLQTFSGQASTLNTTTYSYSLALNARANAMALRTVSTMIGVDDTPIRPVRKVVTQEHNLFNGAKWLVNDGDDLETHYQHDKLGRTIIETVSPNSKDYKASRYFTYTLTNGGVGQQATQTVKDVNGVETVSWLDGHNRVIKITRRDADALGGDPQAYRQTYKAMFNNLGQLISETMTDWEGPKDVHLTSTFEYDVWGEQYKVIGPDGVAHVTEIDPSRQRILTWAESPGPQVEISGRGRRFLNSFGKEDRTQALDAQGNVLSERQFLYDGLGACVEQINEMGDSTRFDYDLFSRLQTTTLPDSIVIHRTYASHSPGDLPVELKVTDSQTTTTVGIQRYDGLGRRTALKVGPRLQQFEYQGGSSRVSKMITASNKTITYEYSPELVNTPVSSAAPDEQSSFNYDSKSAQITRSQNTQGEHRFDYSYNGQLRRESWKDQHSGKEWETRYTHTLNGRPITRLTVDGLICSHAYDDQARVKQISQGHLLSTFDYDALGRAHVITTVNHHARQKLVTTLTFDDLGREITRHMALDGHPAQTITQDYRADSKLKTRHLQVGSVTELRETFDYDMRGRMVQYNCEGTKPPKDHYGNEIREQSFIYDALDNVQTLYTFFVDGSFDEAQSTFSLDDPCQLIEVQHTHAAYPPSFQLDYDEDGHLLHDQYGQTLNYDSQGRLMSVTGTDGRVVSQYRYDAHNHLLGVTRGAQAETLRFYQNERLSSTEQNDRKIHYLYLVDQPLGQQEQDAPEKTLLLMADGKNSVLAESGQENGQSTLRKAVYNAYGERNPDDELQCLLGFNGEVRDELSGWYLLGRAHRAYNPTLMRFHSPDSLSPFEAGGINPYVYCSSDPINKVDPTGHYNRGVNWEGASGITMTAGALAMSIWAAILAAPTGPFAIFFTIMLELLSLIFAIMNIDQGLKATTAVKAEDREASGKQAMIGGGIDLAVNALLFLRAINMVRKTQKSATDAALTNGLIHRSVTDVNELKAAQGTVDRASGSVVDNGVEAASGRGSVVSGSSRSSITDDMQLFTARRGSTGDGATVNSRAGSIASEGGGTSSGSSTEGWSPASSKTTTPSPTPPRSPSPPVPEAGSPNVTNVIQETSNVRKVDTTLPSGGRVNKELQQLMHTSLST